ncbi:MAG: hypothetical protein WBQ94_15110 [Terracidiphilus sp.]
MQSEQYSETGRPSSLLDFDPVRIAVRQYLLVSAIPRVPGIRFEFVALNVPWYATGLQVEMQSTPWFDLAASCRPEGDFGALATAR